MSAPLNIAVLEDHDALRELTVAALQRHGHHTFGVYDASALDELLASVSIDLLLLDLTLPGEDGLSVAQRLKAVMPKLFIIMTTAKGSIEDRIAGYDCGADIYLPKPVSEDELLAAVAGLGRRIAQAHAGSPSSLLRLNETTLQLSGLHSVMLNQTETTLLKIMALAPGRRATTARLLEATQREVDARTKASLEVQIVNLRKKIAATGFDQPAIRAIHKEGYRLLCPLQLE